MMSGKTVAAEAGRGKKEGFPRPILARGGGPDPTPHPDEMR